MPVARRSTAAFVIRYFLNRGSSTSIAGSG
jgi:hypothetical protein